MWDFDYHHLVMLTTDENTWHLALPSFPILRYMYEHKTKKMGFTCSFQRQTVVLLKYVLVGGMMTYSSSAGCGAAV